jgi:hypothetical protein
MPRERPSACPTTGSRKALTGNGARRAWRTRGARRHPAVGLQEATMAKVKARPDIETIIKDPVKHFRTPRDVVADAGYTREEKRRILDSWALDAQFLEVAEEENMAGADRPRLREVKLALLELEKSGGR